MTIRFGQIGANTRTPAVLTEIDASQAVTGLGQIPSKVLIVGQKLAASTTPADTVYKVATQEEVDALAGVGSHASDVYSYFSQNNSTVETELLLLGDGTTAKEYEITVSAPATSGGAIALYIGGRRILVAVTNGDTANDIAAAIDAAINDDDRLLFSSTVATNVVTVTSKNGGEWTDKLSVVANRFSPERGGSDRYPEGVSLAIASTQSGAGNPSLTTALSAVPDEIFRYILMPFNDATSNASMEAFLEDRQNANVALEGHSFNAFKGTRAESSTHGNALNGKYQTTMQAGTGEGAITPEHGYAAAYCAKYVGVSIADPLLPATGQQLLGVVADYPEDRLQRSERNILLFDGIATHTVSDAGQVAIERSITNYQKNALNQPDPSFLDSQTPITLSFIRQSFNIRMSSTFLNKKLADDPLIVGAGSNVVSPNIIRGEIIAWGLELATQGIIENFEEFKNTLIVERDGSDVNRVNVSMSPDIVNQVRLIANKITFIL